MRILQIGAGSMGTRRLRDLSRRPDIRLALFDVRRDRRDQARQRFGLPTFATLEDGLGWGPDAVVISTPPGTKKPYIEAALREGLHHFSEADIWTYGAAAIDGESRRQSLVGVPSAALHFLPVVRALRQRARDHLGQLLFYQAFMATYMPGWHPQEGMEYYARHRDTTAAREMIPFELTWLSAIFGEPEQVAGRFGRHGRLDSEIEDTWSLSFSVKTGGEGQLVITMACPVGCRRGSASGTRSMITWDIYNGELALKESDGDPWRREEHGPMASTLEESYAEEIFAFVAAVQGGTPFPQTYTLTSRSTGALAAAERSAIDGRWRGADEAGDPELSLPHPT